MSDPMRYEPLKTPRFIIESVEGRDRIRVKAGRNLLLALFMLFWLCAWTVGGVSAMATLHKTFSLFLLFWLGAWAVGWTFVALQLGWFFTGSETFSVINGDLEIAYRIFGLTIRRLYRGQDIRDLAARPLAPITRYRLSLPFASWSTSGCVRFSYGARTIYGGGDLDEVEGRLIVDRLLKRLPKTASLAP